MATYHVIGKLYSDIQKRVEQDKIKTIEYDINAATPSLAIAKFRESNPEYMIWRLDSTGAGR
jgi:hypothetical protein